MTEIRRTNATGGAKGDKLARFDQIPAEPLLELAYRYGLGSTKYPAVNGLDNWRNGYEFSLSIAALERHINAFKRGEDNDDTIYRETGLIGDDEDPLYDEEGKLRPGVSHLAAVAWHCFFLMYHLVHHPELDDRPSTVLSRKEHELESLEGVTQTLEFSLDNASLDFLQLVFGTPQRWVSAMPPDWTSLAPYLHSSELDNEDDFTVAKARHQALINDWHNRPKTDDIVLKPGPPATREDQRTAQIKQNALREKQAGDFAAKHHLRVDQWLETYGIELLAGDLGDCYTGITISEFADRLFAPGVEWRVLEIAEKSGVAQSPKTD